MADATNPHINRPPKLVGFEIERYFDALAGVAVTHRWLTRRGNKDVFMPEGVSPNLAVEEAHIKDVQERLGRGAEGVIYSGPISPEQALGEILVRREALDEFAKLGAMV